MDAQRLARLDEQIYRKANTPERTLDADHFGPAC